MEPIPIHIAVVVVYYIVDYSLFYVFLHCRGVDD